MRSRDLRAAAAAFLILAAWFAFVLLTVAALPGSSITASGTGTNARCGAAQTLFSSQDCNVPTLASVSDEFDSSTSAANWTIASQYGSPTDSAAFEPYVLVPSANRYTYGGWRQGWFSTQPIPSAPGGTRQALALYRDYTPPNEATIYIHWSMTGPNADAVGYVQVSLISTASTAPNAVVGAGCRYTYGAASFVAWSDTGTSTALVNPDDMPLYGVIVMHKLGDQYWCWGGTDDGRAVYIGTRTRAFTPARIWVAFAYGDTGTGPGAPIFHIDYIRVVENERFLP